MEVNFPNKAKKQPIELFGIDGKKKKEEMPFSIIANLYNEVLINLSDTFGRLKTTNEYGDFMRKKQLTEQELKAYL
jgi:hypothetical protein